MFFEQLWVFLIYQTYNIKAEKTAVYAYGAQRFRFWVGFVSFWLRKICCLLEINYPTPHLNPHSNQTKMLFWNFEIIPYRLSAQIFNLKYLLWSSTCTGRFFLRIDLVREFPISVEYPHFFFILKAYPQRALQGWAGKIRYRETISYRNIYQYVNIKCSLT